MSKYHINKKGKVEPCNATTRACPFGEENHIEANSPGEAIEKFDEIHDKEDTVMEGGKMDIKKKSQYTEEELNLLERIKNEGLARFPEITNPTNEIRMVSIVGVSLSEIPEKLKTPKLCLEAVKNHGTALNYVPEEFRTKELCVEAVKQNGWALQYVPEKLITKELCVEAVKTSVFGLEYVPRKNKTQELCKIAFDNNKSALQYIPKKYRTEELCLEAVKENGFLFQYVPKHLKTDKLRKIALETEGYKDISSVNSGVRWVFI